MNKSFLDKLREKLTETRKSSNKSFVNELSDKVIISRTTVRRAMAEELKTGGPTDAWAQARRRRMNQVGILIAIACLLLTVYLNLPKRDRDSGSSPVASSVKPAEPKAPLRTSTTASTGLLSTPTSLPGSLYDIMTDKVVAGNRRIEIRIQRIVDENTLRSISMKLQSEDDRHFGRTYIFYYLPDMTVGEGAWATGHFDPDLKIRIQGFTEAGSRRAAAAPLPTGTIVGQWLDNSAFVGSRIVIYRTNGKTYMSRTFVDASADSAELSESQSPNGRRFQQVNDTDSGDYFLLTSAGALELRDREGLISTAKQIH